MEVGFQFPPPPPPPKFCHRTINFEATLLYFGDFPKNSFTPCSKRK